jgi:hypothetical protein
MRVVGPHIQQDHRTDDRHDDARRMDGDSVRMNIQRTWNMEEFLYGLVLMSPVLE